MSHLQPICPPPFRPLPAPVRREEPSAIVHVVDRDEVAMRLIAGLGDAMGLEVRTHASIEAFLDGDRPDLPGCLVVDARITRPGGLPLGHRHRPMVVTAAQADVSMAVRAMKAGAIDFLEKPLREGDVLEAIGIAIELDRDRRAVEACRANTRLRFATLTRREREVMALVTAGRLNKQVAGDLGLSEVTVKVHRGSVMRKMGCRAFTDLVRMVDALGGPGAVTVVSKGQG